MRLFEKWRQARRWRERVRSTPMEEVRDIYERRFRLADPERFRFLWLEIAAICGVEPTKLHENDVLIELCPGDWWTHINLRMDEIEQLALRESGNRSVPNSIDTVGGMMDWLLDVRSGVRS